MTIKKIKTVLRNIFFNELLKHNWFLSDKQYSSWRYWFTFGKKIDWKNPKSFNEKIQYLKICHRKEVYKRLVDKYKVRGFVSKIIGKKYLNKLLGVYKSFDEIDFNKLPNRFVLKAVHGSGWNIICKDKSLFDYAGAKKDFDMWCGADYSKLGREWVYSNIEKRIVGEKYLEDKNGELLDYKFFCFDGTPRYVQVDIDRFSDHTRDFYDIDWKLQPFEVMYKRSGKQIKKPEKFDEMCELAKKLSKGFSFLRVDLYKVDGKIFFGELTFYPGNGFEKFYPAKYDLLFGNLLKL